MPGAAPDVLDLRVRTKAYPTTGGAPLPVLRDISVHAHGGEVLALLGRSGTGKTTLLRIALSLDAEFDGSVALPRGRIGAVFQEPRLLPWLTVEDNLRLVVTADVPSPDIPALLAAVGLPETGSRHPAELSRHGAPRRRGACARGVPGAAGAR